MKIMVILVITIIILVVEAIRYTIPKPYGLRSCQGWNWHRSFPNVPTGQIREFLTLFACSFAIRDGDKLKFNPDDKLWDIYAALNPCKWIDSMEFEILHKNLDEKYGFDLGKVLNKELTLSQLFSHIRDKNMRLGGVKQIEKSGLA